MKTGTVVLSAKAIKFYSNTDEDMFFEWLKRLPCVVNVEGRGMVLYIHVEKRKVNIKYMLELISVFKRYSINMRQLSVFLNKSNYSILVNEKAYWYKRIFPGGFQGKEVGSIKR